MEKVVLARQQRIQAQRRLDPVQLMASLNYLYPRSTLLATRIDGRVFVSATPERLASYHAGEITCDAMAGTAQRAPVELQDGKLGAQLLADPKSRHEHQLVVDGIRASMKQLCSDISPQQPPTLKRLRGLQHLFTEIRGQLRPETGLIQAAARLHPTAAVNGHPATAASHWLQQHEPFDRGWYAGAAGWIDCHGNGELAVLLRCALLDRDQAELFAGAGITSGSDADAEYAETELKFGVMLEALENS
jgi:menaquinone-specific isochorismate synthase